MTLITSLTVSLQFKVCEHSATRLRRSHSSLQSIFLRLASDMPADMSENEVGVRAAIASAIAASDSVSPSLPIGTSKPIC